ncbi:MULTISPECIES: AAA family ATPase [unclassified Photobacterium]|uniref:AAA family ATPase n=1 Tax=unclassified Photobacterium TaxID=2628852 RepID=UPI000D16CED4|nr:MULTISPECIES: AAA family ATPase [unclassified Photobacterium]PSV27736.1 AAA family ATPase [Photobacterium sp. GB-56]PSV38560.1 AAA family ATPase [Photobacterium sp. GB-210]
MSFEEKPYLREIALKREKIDNYDQFPFCIPALKALDVIEFHPDVTFFVGENGSGKSTLIEAIAVAMGLNAEGGNKNTGFATAQTHSELDRYIKTVKSFKRPKDFYFLRAESFYNVATYLDQLMPPPLQGYGGQSLHHQSHGESFMATISNKLRGNGLYIMDEPEAALSPARQMAALSEMHRLVEAGSQFIIATHSPILLAYPRAKIYQFSDSGIDETTYEDTEHYEITRNFLNHHQQMMKILMEEE